MEKIELKPCPFCGEDPQVIRIKGKDGWRDRYTVRCPYDHGGCGAEGGMYHSEEEAVWAWNQRTPAERNAIPLEWIESYIETCNMIQLRVNVPASKIISVMVKTWRQENHRAKRGEADGND